jgi:hypothetical protein
MKNIMNKVSSFYDNRGYLFVDCTECNRGINGKDNDECSCGFKTKQPGLRGCFLGDIIPTIDLSKAKKLI